MSVATYRGTGGTVLRSGGWTVLLGVAPAHPLVGLCWERLDAASDPDEVLETIVAEDVRPVPAFALVRETGVRRVVAYGPLALLLDATDVGQDTRDRAWVDLPLAGVARVEVALPGSGPGGPELPLRDGVAAATGFGLVLDGAEDAATTYADHPFAETLTTRAAREAGTVTVRVRRPTAPATAEDTLPTTFTTGLAPPSTVPTAGRDLFVSREQLMRGTDGLEAPRVLAAVCPAGHLTPAYSGVCRVCRRGVVAQEAFETARPVLGRLVLPQGDAVPLDRGAVLGRLPFVPPDWAGAQPHLVALHDPDHDVSAQHVSVLLDLWDVLVCDLGSTNGTELVDADGQVTLLRPYEPVALGPGGALVLADVVTVRFEVHP